MKEVNETAAHAGVDDRCDAFVRPSPPKFNYILSPKAGRLCSQLYGEPCALESALPSFGKPADMTGLVAR